MDFRFSSEAPTDAEREAVDRVVGAAAPLDPQLRVAHAERERRDLLLPALHALQDRVGWISRGGLDHVCRRLSVAPAEAYGVASFYDLFSLEPRPARIVHACVDIACAVAGGRVDGEPSPCLGLCERAPAALVVEAGESPVSAPVHDGVWDAGWSVPQRGDEQLVLLARAGVVDPGSLASYEAQGGYDALRKAFEIGATTVVDEVVRSGLVGRGGAAFPTGRKWQAVAAHASRPHYLVANADESEPGTFKDRVLIENDPFSLVEAMTIAAFATGCERGYVYLRGEYPIAWRRLADAIDAARTARYLGRDILGRGVRFDIEMRKGAGAYICGEETALFNSIEGYRGEPRSKPPFPVDVGLFGQPTVANNVETLVNVLPIVLDGGEAFARTGSGTSTGTKLFCVSGHVGRPGVYEVPFGPTLGDVLELAGGVGGTGRLQAVLLGGVAGRFVGPEALDTPLTFEGARSIGASLGSGVILPLDDTVDLRPLVVRIAEFFRHESCGQCVPCRVGTVRQQEALVRLTKGSDVNRELALIDEVGRCMRDASICGLGQTAYDAVDSALRRFQPFGAGSADG
jgi:NADH-quinone oxidoreductase subunit F